ncbi:Phosphatidylinositol-3-phosphatase SAC1 [Stygiomarasmius scandens]|uniref:Phosphatidylinositol-3-phosphatase SAC1 n=1 Tax=Marasmiellus scandens TaxID=2682957 RepID=A0ABR1JZB3_9AGAR
MSSPNGKMEVDKSPNHKSSRNHSTDTLRTRRSHRSTSRDRSDRDRRDKDRRRDRDDRRRRSRSRDRYDRDRSRDRYRDRDRDRERRRERDSDRYRSDRRERGESRHSHRDYDKEDKERERRRKRSDEMDDVEGEERPKKKKLDEDVDGSASPRSPRRRRSRPPKDPRDEFDDPLRYRQDHRDDRRPRRGSPPYRRRYNSPSPPPVKRPSPTYEPPPDEPYNPDEPKEDDSEARSVFVSQLAARLTARDLGYFFEDKLGEGTVNDSRIVTDRLSRRSKGIGYVEFRSIDLVEKAMALSGTVVMGLPIMVQLTEAERNRLHPGDGNLNLPPGVSAPHGGMQLYVGSLHFNLTESDIKQVFEPFGALEFVDLHRDPMTGRSKGYAFVQYKRAEDAKMALEQMEGFELAGRTLRVNTVHEKGSIRYTQQDSLEESGGGNLNAASRQALMQKLARTESQPSLPEPVKLNIPQQAMQSRSVLLKNMFDPEEETERDWDKDLAMDVRGECEEKYGPVEAIKVEKETQGEIYVKFDSIESAKKAVQGLNGRWFGGKQVTATFISDAIMQAHQ